MRTHLITTFAAGLMMAGAAFAVAPAMAQTTDATCTPGYPCARGVPPAAAGGQAGSGPAALRDQSANSPVATGAGGGGPAEGGAAGGSGQPGGAVSKGSSSAK